MLMLACLCLVLMSMEFFLHAPALKFSGVVALDLPRCMYSDGIFTATSSGLSAETDFNSKLKTTRTYNFKHAELPTNNSG
jgi:hypothetical protein